MNDNQCAGIHSDRGFPEQDGAAVGGKRRSQNNFRGKEDTAANAQGLIHFM